MFGGGSELLMGGGAFDSSAMTNGGGIGSTGNRSRSGSGAATPTPGSGTSAFDLNDFPSLGGASVGGVSVGGVSVGGVSVGGVGSDGLAAALRQQQLAQQQLLQGANKSSSLYRTATAGQAGINMAAEDFPALPGVPAPSSSVGSAITGLGGLGGLQRENSSNPASSPFVGATPTVSRASSSGSGGLGLFGAEIDGMLGQKQQLEGLIGGSGGSAIGSIGGAPAGTIGSRSSTAPAPSSKAPGSATSAGGTGASSSGVSGGAALSSDYGLLGLLSIIRMTDADRNALALGSDLTALGMNLNSSDKLYSTFASPWSESPTAREPQYQLPMCYYMQPPALKTGHLSKFQLETLFYIFYALPKDVLQAYAAQELYSREWRYHVDLKLWFKRGGASDGLAATSNGGNQYIYFDAKTWERRLFNGNVQSVTSGFLSEDDVRVKFSSS